MDLPLCSKAEVSANMLTIITNHTKPNVAVTVLAVVAGDSAAVDLRDARLGSNMATGCKAKMYVAARAGSTLLSMA